MLCNNSQVMKQSRGLSDLQGFLPVSRAAAQIRQPLRVYGLLNCNGMARVERGGVGWRNQAGVDSCQV